MSLKISIVIVLLTISIIPVFAQTEETPFLTVTTDDNHYDEGDIVVVSGKVQTVIVDTPIILQTWFKDNLIQVDQFFPAQDGSFSNTIIAQKPLWNKEGEYLILVSYGGKVSETTVTYSPKKEFIETKDIIEVNIPNGGTFDAEYTILGGIVKDMILEPDNFTLRILLDAPDEGTISIKLPREAIDAIKQNGQDEKFIILIDDVQNPYTETPTESGFRLVTINFEEGDSEMEIIGTFTVPEFGNITYLILIISVMTMVIFAKSKFQLKILSN